jgi:glycosyltransferase involved in cell wall biosynthesis
MVEVLNMGTVTQGWGRYTLPPLKWTPVDDALAKQLAVMPDYRVDTPLDDFLFERDGNIHIGWSGPFWYPDGYGSISQEIADELLRMSGVKTTIKLRDYDPSQQRCGGLPLERWGEAFVPQSIIDRLQEKQEEPLYGINFTYPKDCHRSAFARTIGYTMFETTATPSEWTRSMNLCRRLMVPSAHCIDAFRSRGVTVPVDVVPQGVNPENWPVIDRSDKVGPFTFLIMGGLTYRKNPIGAVRAFLAAFPHERDVRLLIKTRAGKIAGGFKSWIDQIPNDDRVQIIAENSTPRDMLMYMGKADAFLWPSRGEGFGLPTVQAMSTGLPIIVADNSGMSQYCDGRYNYPIPCQEVKVPSQANGGYPDEWGDCGNWWEPDFASLVAAIREVYNNRTWAAEKGNKAAEWVRDNWTIGHTCQRILEVVCDDAKESGLEW